MEKNKNSKPYKKPITKQNLHDSPNFVFNDLETIDYNNDARLDDLNDLETVDYNTKNYKFILIFLLYRLKIYTFITDLVTIKNLKQLKKKMDYRLKKQ